MGNSEQSMTERAYLYLHDKIQNCDYMPNEPLFEKQICEELSCGRTPVREALLALKNDGLVDVFPRKGMCVRPITKQYVNEIYQVRKILESTVASQFCQLYDKSELLVFDERFKNLNLTNDREYFTFDIDFHRFLIHVTGNQTMIKFYDNLMQVQYRLGMYSSKCGTAVKDDTYKQHHAIIEAILSEDTSAITQTITQHTNQSLIIALKTIAN
ncbi:hypothetical protein CS063_12400 [Sporanaerobium hydrogeniformans]|uniref:Uncharacterized protein n=1 Tax=Sporanaerobium hydrogeniformans TaxID=3072179 RepID=A0AC61D9Z0_9FIRM|nr:GntR family transcriptional regulator [Sporanaerobium hydrogeniformans]PHV70099.1 hypothetical protein CS063_12400 [Sporanaerobium hydrogeniformans]